MRAASAQGRRERQPKKIPCRPQFTVLCQFTCRNADTDRADSGSSWPMGRQGRCEKDQNGLSHQPVSSSNPARELTKPCKLWTARDSAWCQSACVAGIAIPFWNRNRDTLRGNSLISTALNGSMISEKRVKSHPPRETH